MQQQQQQQPSVDIRPLSKIRQQLIKNQISCTCVPYILCTNGQDLGASLDVIPEKYVCLNISFVDSSTAGLLFRPSQASLLNACQRLWSELELSVGQNPDQLYALENELRK